MSERIAHIAKEAKSKTKRVLHVDDTKQQFDRADNPQSKIEENAGFSPTKTGNVESSMSNVLKAQIPKNMHHLAHMMRHSRSGAIQNWTEDSIALSEEPYISREDDDYLVDAVEDLKRVEDATDSASEPEGLVSELRSRVEGMEDDRERKRVAWITSKYIQKARVIRQGSSQFPLLSSYRWIAENGEPQGEHWVQWFRELPNFFHHLRNRPSVRAEEERPNWNREEFLQEVERVVIASGPMQNWLSRLTKLASWEDSKRSGALFAFWLALWFMNYTFRFILCYLAYGIVTKQSKQEDRDRMQESHNRSGDGDATVNTIGEKISRHGSTGWVDPAFEEIGPDLQPHVKKLADWMEVLVNFRDWKTPRATISILLMLAGLIAFGTFASTDVCVRVVTLTTIFGFFLHRPISLRYPEYHLILLPFFWILWDVPTHLETSFRYLRTQAESILNQGAAHSYLVPSKNLDASESVLENVFMARCEWNSKAGNVVLGSDHIRFVRLFPKEEMWRHSLSELVEVRKGKEQISIIKTTQNFLKLDFAGGSTEKVAELKSKDELFNVIIAFSGLAWQQL